MANVTRKLTKVTVPLYRLDTTQTPPAVETVEPIIFMCGKPSDRIIREAVNKQHGRGHGLTMGNPECEEAIYAIPLDVFMEHAVKVDAASVDNDDE